MPSFIHPGLAAAALATAVVPILIHILSRRRFRRQPWAAMRFLKRAQRKSRRRFRIEQWLLLSLRTAAVLLFGLAVARPSLSAGRVSRAIGEPRADRVIVLDDSLSMHARRPDGRSSFDRAKDAARTLLAQFNPADAVAVHLVSAGDAAAVSRPSADQALAARALDAAMPRHDRGDSAAALRAAARIVMAGDAPPSARAVYLLTDLNHRDWFNAPAASTDVPPAIAAAREVARVARLALIDCGPPARYNLALTDLTCEDALVGCDFPVRFTASIDNFGASTSSPTRLEVQVNQTIVQTLDVPAIPAAGRRAIPFSIRFERPEVAAVSAHLLQTRDALAADDTRARAVEVGVPRRVLIVDGHATAGPASDSFYLRHALAPRARREGGAYFAPTVIADVEFDGTPLHDVAIVALTNAGPLSDRSLRRLMQFVDAGGGLWLLPGNRTPVEQWQALAPRLLPVRLDSIRSSESDAAHPTRPAVADPTHPILRDLGGPRSGGLLSAEIRRFWRAEPAPSARVILRLDTGDPFLIEHDVGRGRVACLLSAPTMEWNNLAAKPDFVPLVLATASRLAPSSDSTLNRTAGQPCVIPVREGAADRIARLTRPDGSVSDVPPMQHDGRVAYVLDGDGPRAVTSVPGVYELASTQCRRRIAVTAPPEESDLRPAEPRAIREAIDGQVTIIDAVGVTALFGRDAPTSEIGGAVFGAAFLLVLAETLLAAWFGHRT
ncbi:MAG: BatA domain-containing protein [Phycisphaerae bacterium]|nr:BatA domain-containing protein [Phycisphaerae bacterium]